MADIQPTTQSISDDQELAKVLAGVSQQDESLQYEEVSLPAPAADPVGVAQSASDGSGQSADSRATGATDNELVPIKIEAINELRPLVDKLDLPPEEKFDTYLLLIRSTDDKTLVAPAYAAAKAIVDEGRRAEALLSVIKEIDFLSNPQQ